MFFGCMLFACMELVVLRRNRRSRPSRTKAIMVNSVSSPIRPIPQLNRNVTAKLTGASSFKSVHTIGLTI